MNKEENSKLDQLCIDTIRTLCAEMIDKANSGHPGMALDAAPILHVLFTRYLKASTNYPNWINRDYFILSSGHASSLLYAMLYVSGYKLYNFDLERFRQYGSNTPGHPERGVTQGVDASTGPLGQGVAEAVGVAIAEAHLNKVTHNAIDHYTYCLCGDGDLQEGVCQEALSIAGNLRLNKLIILYDSNDIQLDGPVSDSNNEDIRTKYESMGFKYIKVKDANNCKEIELAIGRARIQDKPVFIEFKTKIGYGTSVEGTNKAHGTPLPHEEVVAMRNKLPNKTPFSVQSNVSSQYIVTFCRKGNKASRIWYEEYERTNDQLLKNLVEGKNDYDIDSFMPRFLPDYNKATRVSGGEILDSITRNIKLTMGGSADLSSSTKVKGADGNFTPITREGRNIKFGVREHAMGAICNGLAIHGLKPFCSTFFAFVDYLKPAIRLAAISNLAPVFIFTHDSIAVGEDGPTHHPVEQLTMVRSIPNCNVIRPCDANECKAAYKIAFSSKKTPTVIVLSRQNLETVVSYEDQKVEKGAYIISDSTKEIPDGILIASGSEVKLALDTKEELEKDGLDIRVVSMPSTNLFDKQDEKYKNQILPNECRKRMAIEMSDATHFYKYVGLDGIVFNIDCFGTSGKSSEVIKKYGFTKENLAREFKNLK